MMEKAKIVLKIMATCLAACAIFVVNAKTSTTQAIPSGSDLAQRADIIRIDGLKEFGPLERPPVSFLHDKHVEAVKKQDQDCSACHLEKDQRRVLRFKRLANETKPQVMDLYHAQCIGCHQENRQAKRTPNGPETCNGCHLKKAPAQSNWQPIALDKSLHYRHVRATQDQCGTCHHDFDQVNQSLVYKQGQEESCRFCHRDKPQEKSSSLRLASHRGCISCHEEFISQNKLAGPTQCGGCHDAARQAEYEVVQDPPRLKRNQPDTTIIQQGLVSDETAKTAQTRIPAVAFNHQGHENKAQSCRVCHHESIGSCNACHLSQPSQEHEVPLVQAMHQTKAGASCTGCHAQEKQKPGCAGCHQAIPTENQLGNDSCGTCHVFDIEPSVKLDAHQRTQFAGQYFQSRPTGIQPLAAANVPEEIKINGLEKLYEAVVMPHGKIVRALRQGVSQSSLATAFHRQDSTLCQGCHHGTPATDKPVGCKSCHSTPFNAKDLFKPGLKGAYHQQCMGCHQTMKIEKALGCTDCHAKK